MKSFKFTINGNEYQVEIKSFEEHTAEVEVNGTAYHVEVHREVKVQKTPKLIRPKTPRAPGEIGAIISGSKLAEIKSPLPGIVLSILVKEGDEVKKEQVLLILEAMKMENKVLSEVAGKVKSIKIQAGDNVLQGQVLIEIE
jgi:biotin carboxyl carrier protein